MDLIEKISSMGTILSSNINNMTEDEKKNTMGFA